MAPCFAHNRWLQRHAGQIRPFFAGARVARPVRAYESLGHIALFAEVAVAGIRGEIAQEFLRRNYAFITEIDACKRLTPPMPDMPGHVHAQESARPVARNRHFIGGEEPPLALREYQGLFP